jgi:CheY-like chemotaxis protein
VEDDDLVRGLVQRMLERLGYAVLPAASGPAALALLSSHTDPIDLLLTDVGMPQMGGRDLAARVAELRPSVRVLYMSGYTDDEILRQGITLAGLPLIQKPFPSEVLGQAIREVLDA